MNFAVLQWRGGGTLIKFMLIEYKLFNARLVVASNNVRLFIQPHVVITISHIIFYADFFHCDRLIFRRAWI